MKVGGQKGGLLFIHEDGSPMTRSSLVKGIRRMLQGYPTIYANKYAGHSFQEGAATRVRVSECIIKRLIEKFSLSDLYSAS